MNKLEPISEPCDSCGRMLVTTIPFISKNWVGLEAPECLCGEDGGLAIAVGRTPEMQAQLDALLLPSHKT